jgi:hypothetical protein
VMEIVSQQRDNVCPLWVISGHVRLRDPKSRHSRRRSAMSVIANSGLLKLPHRYVIEP